MSKTIPLTLFVALIVVLLGQPLSEAMIYRPTLVPGMGDQWLYFHDGTHYLYHLYEQPAGKLHGVYLATSKDGVHFQEVGIVIEKKPDAEWLGSGSVWRSGDKYIMNFSEARGHQSISFAESDDLIHWRRLGDAYSIHAFPAVLRNARRSARQPLLVHSQSQSMDGAVEKSRAGFGRTPAN